MMAPRLSNELREKVMASLREEANAYKAAKLIPEVSLTSIWRIAHKAGIKLTASKYARRAAPLSPEERKAIIKALKRNSNAKNVAAKIGHVSVTTVRYIARKEKIDLKDGKKCAGSKRIGKQKRKAIVKKLQENHNARQTARLFGDVSHELVRQIAHAENIALSRGAPVRKETEAPALG